MDLIIRFMTETKFGCTRDCPADEPISRRRAEKELRLDWIWATAALIQTRRSTVEEKLAWTTRTTRYLVADRMSPFSDPRDRSKLLTYKDASQLFLNESAALEVEVMRLNNDEWERTRNVRPGRRFPHH